MSEENKIHWKSLSIKSSKYNGSKSNIYLLDECGHWQDPNLLKYTDWKPKLWYGYKDGKLVYDKSMKR